MITIIEGLGLDLSNTVLVDSNKFNDLLYPVNHIYYKIAEEEGIWNDNDLKTLMKFLEEMKNQESIQDYL